MKRIIGVNISRIRNNFLILALFLILLFVFLTNTIHFTYPDEFDNIVGGYYITHGILPYTGFFTHHNPFAYFFAAPLVLLGGNSFVHFRFLLALAYLTLSAIFYIYLRKRFGKTDSYTFIAFLFISTIGATYYWGHMLLADSLAGILLMPAYIIVFYSLIKNESFRSKDIWFISILVSLTLLTSLTYIYACIILYIFTIVWYLSKQTWSQSKVRLLKTFLIITLPYLIFGGYLLLTGSINDYYYQSIFYTKEYYATSFDGNSINNPLRLAIVILNTFLDNYRAALVQIKDFNLGNPFVSAFALSNLLTIIYLIVNKKFKLAILVAGMIIYVNVRGNPLNTSETDYQAIIYHYLSIFNGVFLLLALWKDLEEKIKDNKKILYGFSLLLLGTYFLFLSLFFLQKWADKTYKKYMGTQATIYDRPLIANTLNTLINPSDYYFIGPFAFEEHFYTKGKLASKYFIVLPGMDKSEKIQAELINDISKNKPKIIVYDTEYAIYGHLPGSFLINYLKQNYFNLEQLKNSGEKFQIKNNRFGNFDFERHFFFDNNRKDEIINLLKDKGLISQS